MLLCDRTAVCAIIGGEVQVFLLAYVHSVCDKVFVYGFRGLVMEEFSDQVEDKSSIFQVCVQEK